MKLDKLFDDTGSKVEKKKMIKESTINNIWSSEYVDRLFKLIRSESDLFEDDLDGKSKEPIYRRWD